MKKEIRLLPNGFSEQKIKELSKKNKKNFNSYSESLKHHFKIYSDNDLPFNKLIALSKKYNTTYQNEILYNSINTNFLFKDITKKINITENEINSNGVSILYLDIDLPNINSFKLIRNKHSLHIESKELAPNHWKIEVIQQQNNLIFKLYENYQLVKECVDFFEYKKVKKISKKFLEAVREDFKKEKVIVESEDNYIVFNTKEQKNTLFKISILNETEVFIESVNNIKNPTSDKINVSNFNNYYLRKSDEWCWYSVLSQLKK
jgi:hypothetical protein